MGLAVPSSEDLGEAQMSSESSEDKRRMGREGVLLLQEGMFLGAGGALAQCPEELPESRAMWPGHTAGA